VQSFGEKELYIQTSSTGLSSQTGLSSSDGNATTPTPCVTPQPMLSRSEDTVILKVHGISEAGTVFLECMNACKLKAPRVYNIVMCWVVHAIKIMGSSWDDWIY
jgi:hypothetical protein